MSPHEYFCLQLRLEGKEIINSLLHFIKTQNIPFNIGYHQTYVFPSDILGLFNDMKCISKYSLLTKEFGFGDFTEHIYAIERDEKIASACVSVRENEQCGEAWVHTDLNYQRQSFARQVVATWVYEMLKAAKFLFIDIPLKTLPRQIWQNDLGFNPYLKRSVFATRMYNHLIRGVK